MPTDTHTVTQASAAEAEERTGAGDAAPDIDEATQICDQAESADDADLAEAGGDEIEPVGRFPWKRILAYAVLPVLALILALGAAYLKWQSNSAELSQTAAMQSKQAATEITIAMLSYHPDAVDRELPAAANRLTGKFRDQYIQLINDVVVPGAKQKKIKAEATVPAAASVSATENHAVVMVFVNQATTIGDDAPTDSASSVRITLDKVHDRWLVSQFDPI